MKAQSLLLTGFLLFFISASAQFMPQQENAVKAATGSNLFAFDIFHRLGNENNLVFSPFSISVAMAMVQSGATGVTAEEIQKIMHFPDQEKMQEGYKELYKGLTDKNSQNIKLFIANALWHQRDFRISEEYLDVVRKNFYSELRDAEFKTSEGRDLASGDINGWIEEKTENLISDMISPDALNSLTRLVLANAVYFKGIWKEEFDETKTRKDIFYPEEGKNTMAEFMNLKSRIKFVRNDDYSCIELPYSEGDLSMTVMLPAKNDIHDFALNFSFEDYQQMLSSMMYEEVEVFLPKFRFEYMTALTEVLKTMGISRAFSGEADFSGMTGTADLKIDKVLHKAFIEVNEKGTEAAAATVVMMMEKSAGPPDNPEVFKADHPFIYLIRDNVTGTILFMGSLMDPSVSW